MTWTYLIFAVPTHKPDPLFPNQSPSSLAYIIGNEWHGDTWASGENALYCLAPFNQISTTRTHLVTTIRPATIRPFPTPNKINLHSNSDVCIYYDGMAMAYVMSL